MGDTLYSPRKTYTSYHTYLSVISPQNYSEIGLVRPLSHRLAANNKIVINCQINTRYIVRPDNSLRDFSRALSAPDLDCYG